MRLSRSIVGPAEAEAVRRILCENGYLGMGSETQAFEQDLAHFLGVSENQIISVNSGTAALHLAVQALFHEVEPVENGKPEVLVPSLTFVASFQAVSAAGGVPIACDVRADSATIDLEDAAKRLTPRTRAIMPVHYASNPFNLDGVYAFAKEHHLRVVEDAAHAFGCTYKGKKIGSFGDVICFSFDGIKNITCGEGGCIVTSDQNVATLCRDARLLGVKKDTEQRFSGNRSWDFDVDQPGFRYHLSNIMAAIGRVQLTRLESEFAPARQDRAAQYREHLRGFSGVRLLKEEPEAEIIPHILPICIENGKRQFVADHLQQHGIPTGRHYKPNHLLTLYGARQGALPVSEAIFDQLLTLPLHPGLSIWDVDIVCDRLIQALRLSNTP